jgi:hypothetical protein
MPWRRRNISPAGSCLPRTSELFDLVNSSARNCTCEFGLIGVRLATCAPQRMLTEDQRALDGLLFARRMAERLRHEEFSRARNTHTARARSLTQTAAG